MPYLADIHVDTYLSNLSFAYTNAMLIGEEIFPSFNVDKRSDLYGIYGTESFKAYDDLRRPGSDATEVRQTLSKGFYNADEHALRTLVPDAWKTEADSPWSPEIDATIFLTELVRNQREYRQMAVAGDPTQVTQNVALSGTSLWSDYTNSTPLTNIRAGRSAVRAGIHREATDAAMAFDASIVLADHPSIKDLIKYTDPNNIGSGGLPNTLRGLRLHISGADKDTAAYGSAATFAPVFSKAMLIYYRGSTGVRSLAFGATMDAPDQTTGGRGMEIRKWRDDGKKGTWVEGSMTYVVKVLAPLAGYLISPCIA